MVKTNFIFVIVIDNTYKYDENSMRTKKTVNGTTHNYEYIDGKLMYEEYGSTKLYFTYDALGKPYSVKVVSPSYNGNYYYALNWRGDVVALCDENGGNICGTITFLDN